MTPRTVYRGYGHASTIIVLFDNGEFWGYPIDSADLPTAITALTARLADRSNAVNLTGEICGRGLAQIWPKPEPDSH